MTPPPYRHRQTLLVESDIDKFPSQGVDAAIVSCCNYYYNPSMPCRVHTNI